ncbi:MAG: preprotein translocase subunit SecG [Alphaproteobacteria bacterium]
MQTIILLVHLFLALGLVISVLLQRSEGGALGIGGGGMGGLMTSRGSANFLTKVTACIAGMFMVTSLTLAIMASGNSKPRSILDQGTTPPPIEAPVEPGKPAAPLAR